MRQFALPVSRRRVLAVGGATLATALASELVVGQQVAKDSQDLKPGEFSWHPEYSPTGPVAIVVSLPEQCVHVYRNGIRIAVSTCSTGRPGHATPTGVFTILEKDRDHHSSKFNDAPMPNMNRLTWSGIALHAGQLPGYPASHGCVRLPLEFSRLLFGVTQIGTPVIIASDHTDPVAVAHPGLVLAPQAHKEMNEAVAKLELKPQPGVHQDANPTPPLAIVVSAADRQVLVLENGDLIATGAATITDPGAPLGSHVFVLAQAIGNQTYWHGIGHSGDARAEMSDLATLQRIVCDANLNEAIHQRMHPGAVLVTTDLPATPATRTGKDFVVMTAAAG